MGLSALFEHGILCNLIGFTRPEETIRTTGNTNFAQNILR